MPSTDIKDYWRRAWGIGDRVGFQSGQLVRPGVGRQGYSGKKGMKMPFKKKAKAWNLSTKEQTWINETYNKTKTSFDTWWKDIGHPKRTNMMVALENTKKMETKLASLADESLISITEFNKLLGIDSKSKRFKDKLHTPEYQVLEPRVVEGQIGKGGKIRETYLKKPTSDQIKAIKAIHVGSGGKPGIRPFMVKKIQALANNKTFMQKISGPIKDALSDDLLLKILGKGQASENTVMNLARALKGEIDIPGVEKNSALGNSLLEAVGYKADRTGQWNKWSTAKYLYAKSQMNKILQIDPTKDKSFEQMHKEVRKLFKKLGMRDFAVDEIKSLQSGFKRGTGAYSVFVQAIDQRINDGEKRLFDSGSSLREKKLRKLSSQLKSTNKKIAESARVKAREILEQHELAKKQFYIDNPGTKGKVQLASFDLRSPQEVFGSKRWAVLHPNIQKAITDSWKQVGYSVDVGKGALTQKELVDTLNKKITSKATKKLIFSALGATLSLPIAALNQALGAPIGDIPISEKIPVIGGGAFPMTATGQVKDFTSIMDALKQWEENKKQNAITRNILSQPGTGETPAYDFKKGGLSGVDHYILNRFK